MTADGFRNEVLGVIRRWELRGLPPRWTLINTLKELKKRRDTVVASLFESPPLILTATLDDGWGVGIEVIHAACDVLGIPYVFLGLIVSPEVIIRKCEELRPGVLGLTVLHESSLMDLKSLDQNLPENVLILVGGMWIDCREFSRRLKYLKNVLDFMKFFLEPPGK
ncbi:hypothetical protein [Thermodesulforhabdus norvegica]|nr:hypothetical protein [Thermodesulforhabdus norvegica]